MYPCVESGLSRRYTFPGTTIRTGAPYLLFHRANLHRRRVRSAAGTTTVAGLPAMPRLSAAADEPARPSGGPFDIRRVHVVARRMVLGNIERLEIVVGRLDLGPFDHAEPDRKKNPQPARRMSAGSSAACRSRAPRRAAKDRSDREPASDLFRDRFDFLAPFPQASPRRAPSACSVPARRPSFSSFGAGFSQLSPMRVKRAGLSTRSTDAQLPAIPFEVRSPRNIRVEAFARFGETRRPLFRA